MTEHAARGAAMTEVGGRRLAVAVVLSISLALAAGLSTPGLLGQFAPGWAQGGPLAAVVTAEVYLSVIVAHLIAFGARRRTAALAAPSSAGLPGLRTRLRLRPLSARDLGLAIGVLIASWLTAGLLYAVLEPVLGWLGPLARTLVWIGSDGGRLAGAGALLMVIALGRACLLAPLAEELVFRASLFGWLRRRAGAPLTIGVTAVLFAAIHQTPALLPFAFVLGVGAGILREYTGSTTPAIVLHVGNNIALVVAAYVVVGWNAGPMP